METQLAEPSELTRSQLTSATAFGIATYFGAGYWPKGPGTAGSVAAILTIWLLDRAGWQFGPGMMLLLVVLLTLPAVWASDQVGLLTGRKDPQIVVVDEVLGQWITLAALPALTPAGMLAALILFRLFDIAKPWPIRRLERLPGGWGVVADDLLAGLFGAIGIAALRPLL